MKKLLVVLLVLVFAAPAMAAEWNFYGSARAGLWYTQFDEDASGVDDSNGDAESDTDLNYFIQGNSRIGAKVKTSDIIGGRFEYGAFNLRLLYGTVKLGGATLIGGVDYTPVDTLYSNQVADGDNGLNFQGMIYEGRVGQAKLKIAGFQVALITPTVSGVQNDTDVLLPKIELAYDMKTDMFSVGGFLGFQTYEYGDSDESESLTAMVLGARGKFNFGPAYVNFCVAYAQNGADYGLTLANTYAASQNTTGTDVEDATSIMAALVVGAKLGPSLGIEGGVGYLSNSVTDGASDEDTTGDHMAYYIQLPITLAKGFFVVPEISIFDLGENDDGANVTENGRRVDFGAKIQINF
jgi:hypothetical protein